MPKLKAEKKRKTKEFYDPYCFTNAVKKVTFSQDFPYWLWVLEI